MRREDKTVDKLQSLLEQFRNDEKWNTPEKGGGHRFDKEIAWIETMVTEYAAALGKSTDDIVDLMEKGRDYSWPNYYQKANFPGIDSESLYGVFDTFEDFRKTSREKWNGFLCPKCGSVSSHPQECKHRIEKDGKCNWVSYGLFRSGKGVVILESGLAMIPTFEPVPKEKDNV